MERRVRAVVGTAGHVDHGKTTLVTHLSGIDTDRLREEKERGISIELGFAWVDLDEGRVAVVDVPGHERFVRQMIAGAAGIDLVVLVVAADEGVMPQTREHLDICQLLGVEAGAIVVTKTDLVDEEWLELVIDDLADSVAGTFLEGAPIETYARGDEAGLERVRTLIARLVAEGEASGGLAQRSADRPFKLSVDRGFTMRGFGTVVTGTTAAGQLRIGEAVELSPSGVRGRVRGIEVHGEGVGSVGPGVRAAINLQGIDHHQVHRGEVLIRPRTLETTTLLDGTFTALGRLEEPIPDRTRVLVHLGTAQVEGTLVLMGAPMVPPGQTVPVQLRLEGEVAVLPGESYVLRGFTVLPGYGKTLGGGRALTPGRHRHRRRHLDDPTLVWELASAEPERMISALVRAASRSGLRRDILPARIPATGADLEAATGALLARGELAVAGDRLVHHSLLDTLGQAALARLDEHHAANPARPGMAAEELRTRVREDLGSELLQVVLRRLESAGEVRRVTGQKGDVVARAAFEPRRSSHQQAACKAVLAELEAAAMTPPRVAELPELTSLAPKRIDEALDLLTASGEAVRVSRELFFARGPMDELKASLVAHLEEHGEIDAGGLKELTGASRKWTIPLGEYFDRIRLTLRIGDVRRLRHDAA